MNSATWLLGEIGSIRENSIVLLLKETFRALLRPPAGFFQVWALSEK